MKNWALITIGVVLVAILFCMAVVAGVNIVDYYQNQGSAIQPTAEVRQMPATWTPQPVKVVVPQGITVEEYVGQTSAYLTKYHDASVNISRVLKRAGDDLSLLYSPSWRQELYGYLDDTIYYTKLMANVPCPAGWEYAQSGYREIYENSVEASRLIHLGLDMDDPDYFSQATRYIQRNADIFDELKQEYDRTH
jgi:hypothetical protein